MNPKVLLVDDDVELIGMLKEYLSADGFDVTVAYNGADGVREALSETHAIVVLDVMMPGMGGIEALGRIRASTGGGNGIPVLMLTARGDDTDRVVGLELGADDYVPKPCTPRELAARIRAILRRSQMQAPVGAAGNVGMPTNLPISVGDLCIWPEQRRAEWEGRQLELTSTEFSLLETLARNAGQPVSKAHLSEEAMGRPLTKFDRSIDVHMSSIRHKLGVLPDGRSCIQTVYRKGYQLIRS